VFFLVELFKRTSSRTSKLKKLQKLISSLSGTKYINLLSGNEKFPSKKSETFIVFPWWFKIFLYSMSFGCMALSICLIAFKGLIISFDLKRNAYFFYIFFKKNLGIEFGSDNVKNWLTSLVISFLASNFIILPIQVYFYVNRLSKLNFISNL
jgi:hypothetical protein